MMKRLQGFTLIELMVALVAGSVAAIAAFSLGAGISRQFYQQQRVSHAQGSARVSLLELKRDISRAGLFGTPNSDREPTCDVSVPTLPMLGGGTSPITAFQYYVGEDTGVLDDDDMTTTNSTANPGVRADRLRVLTNLSITDQLTVEAVKPGSAGLPEQRVYLNEDLQSYRRTFLWGTSGDYGVFQFFQYFLTGDKNVDNPWTSDGSTVVQYSARGQRAFKRGTVLAFDTPSGARFYRTVFGLVTNLNTQRTGIRLGTDLPLNSSCIAGNGQGMSVAPLEWVEYAVIDPFSVSGFMDFGGTLHIGFDPDAGIIFDWANFSASDLLESPNPMLIRRRLNADTGAESSVQVIAEFVSNFQVSFLIDDRTTEGAPPDLVLIDGTQSGDESKINTEPHRVRAVIIDLSVRSPFEDDELIAGRDNDAGTRFDINPNGRGSARVRRLRVEVPVGNVARRDLI